MAGTFNVDAATKEFQLIAPQVATSTVTPTAGGDVTGATGWGLAVCSFGACSGTSPTCTVKLNESTVSNFATNVDITGATTAALTASVANTVVVIPFELNGRQQYIRAIATIAGTSPSYAISVTLHAGGYADLVSGGKTF